MFCATVHMREQRQDWNTAFTRRQVKHRTPMQPDHPGGQLIEPRQFRNSVVLPQPEGPSRRKNSVS
jgi:hypothetical protein